VPSRDAHIAQARHNVRFYATIDKLLYKDWAATVLFYIGLHYIDAVLAEKGNVHPDIHKTRDNAVARLAELRPIYSNYSALKNASFNARYKPPNQFTTGHINQLETGHLAAVRTEAAKYVQV
jgi:hypothetical protein